MTNTAQERIRVEEQYVEDVATDINDGSLLIDVASGRASMSTRMWNDMVEEIAESRLRARQREGGCTCDPEVSAKQMVTLQDVKDAILWALQKADTEGEDHD